MNKSMKNILLGLYVLSFIIVTVSVIWIYNGGPLRTGSILAKVFFALWTVCFIFLNLLDFPTIKKTTSQQQTDQIRKMVIHGLYSVTLKNGYQPDVFAAFKAEQNRLFDNYEANTAKKEHSWWERLHRKGE